MDSPFLPYDIIFDILIKLPAKAAVRCKCVCKTWLKLMETPEFVKDHLSNSIPGFIVCHDNSLKLFEYVDDELELQHYSLIHYNLITNIRKTKFTCTSLDYTHNIFVEGTVNGLLLLHNRDPHDPTELFVCNPITREYIELPYLETDHDEDGRIYGFGVTATSGLYKVIMILQEYEHYNENENEGIMRFTKSECWVYTLGRGEWKKSIMPCPNFFNYDVISNLFFNGNLHWLLEDLDNVCWISCFDLETEVFSTFSPPPSRRAYNCEPLVLENCLCICERAAVIGSNSEIVIWAMKEYGNDKSWTKQLVVTITAIPGDFLNYSCISPLKLSEDGDVLLLWNHRFVFYYSKKSNTLQKLELSKLHQHSTLRVCLHVSSFLSLGSLAIETVRKF